eukprot:SAG22_NODE_621_length_8504_cov_3.476859_2_plen_98_part_00
MSGARKFGVAVHQGRTSLALRVLVDRQDHDGVGVDDGRKEDQVAPPVDLVDSASGSDVDGASGSDADSASSSSDDERPEPLLLEALDEEVDLGTCII